MIAMPFSHQAPRLLLVDDHALYLTGLRLMLADAWPDADAHVASTWEEADQVVEHEPLDLVLLDVFLPDAQSLVALPSWLAERPDLRVLAMSAEMNPSLCQQARSAGARGFLHKSAQPQEVQSVVRSVLDRGDAWAAVPYAMLGAEPDAGFQAREPVLAQGLSSLQQRILSALKAGDSLANIARACALSEGDVRGELSWVTEMLGARSRQETLSEAEKRGWL